MAFGFDKEEMDLIQLTPAKSVSLKTLGKEYKNSHFPFAVCPAISCEV